MKYIILLVLFLLPAFMIAQSYHVAAYYYPWYGKQHWKAGYWREKLDPPQEPLLGKYNSADETIIRQHLQWAEEYGIDSWICSWWGQRKQTDKVLRKHVLPEMEQTKVQMALFYESAGILGMKNGQIQLNEEALKRLEKDIRYMAQHYFPSESYLKIEGRPVLFIYLTRAFQGRVKDAFTKIREVAAEEGYHIYLVGDEVFWQRPDPEKLRLLDAVTPYNMHGPGQYAGYPSNTRFLEGVRKQYTQYRYVARKEGSVFIPNAFPGFNDQGVRPEAQHYAIPPRLSPHDETGSTFRAYLELATEFADDPLNMITITSFNEWHEDTQIEPSRLAPGEASSSPSMPSYPSYGFIYLELLKIFGE